MDTRIYCFAYKANKAGKWILSARYHNILQEAMKDKCLKYFVSQFDAQNGNCSPLMTFVPLITQKMNEEIR